MKSERDAFVNRTKSNKANGFYPRTLMTVLGKIDLLIPRDRLNEFRPFLLPEKWQRGDQSYDDLIKSLVIHAYSPNKTRSILKNLGLSYSASEIEELTNDLYERSVTFKTQQLHQKVLCLYIDAYHMQRNVRKHMGKNDAKEFNDSLKILRTYKDFDKTLHSFEHLCRQYQKNILTLFNLFWKKNSILSSSNIHKI